PERARHQVFAFGFDDEDDLAAGFFAGAFRLAGALLPDVEDDVLFVVLVPLLALAAFAPPVDPTLPRGVPARVPGRFFGDLPPRLASRALIRSSPRSAFALGFAIVLPARSSSLSASTASR